jgi:hypothetical protein
MIDKLTALVIATAIVVIGAAMYRLGYANGENDGTVKADAQWTSAVVSRHCAYLVKQDGEESYLEWRILPKVRKVPVIHRDKHGNEIDKGGM